MIDFVAVSGTMDGPVIEDVDHLHEHFVDPCVIRNAAYMPPESPRFSIEMKPASIRDHIFRGVSSAAEQGEPAPVSPCGAARRTVHSCERKRLANQSPSFWLIGRDRHASRLIRCARFRSSSKTLI